MYHKKQFVSYIWPYGDVKRRGWRPSILAAEQIYSISNCFLFFTI